MHHPTDRIAHTTAFITPVVEHWLEREIAQWVHPMKDRSDDPPHHERTLLPRSYISLPNLKWIQSQNYSPTVTNQTITTTMCSTFSVNDYVSPVGIHFGIRVFHFNRYAHNITIFYRTLTAYGSFAQLYFTA